MRFLVIAAVLWTSHALASEPIRDIPKDDWVSSFFEEIDSLTSAANIAPLRTASPAKDHVELRIWIGFGLSPLQGYIIQSDDGNWNGVHLKAGRNRAGVAKESIHPRSSWPKAWETLAEHRLLTLPDFSQLPSDDIMVFDGVGYVIETFKDNHYRTYMYGNPQAHDHPEARALESLLAVFFQEFAGGDGKVTKRDFLTNTELSSMATAVLHLKYPIAMREFVKALPFDLPARDLRPDTRSISTQGRDFLVYNEWSLTSRVDPRGYFRLLAYLSTVDLYRAGLGNDVVRHAEVVFYDRTLEASLTLQPQTFPADRVPELPPVTK